MIWEKRYIHEIGLFQGKYGFKNVIVFKEEGVEDFSNISGYQTIKYNNDPEEGFNKLRKYLLKLNEELQSNYDGKKADI